jgi:hypothetical protein
VGALRGWSPHGAVSGSAPLGLLPGGSTGAGNSVWFPILRGHKQSLANVQMGWDDGFAHCQVTLLLHCLGCEAISSCFWSAVSLGSGWSQRQTEMQLSNADQLFNWLWGKARGAAATSSFRAEPQTVPGVVSAAMIECLCELYLFHCSLLPASKRLTWRTSSITLTGMCKVKRMCIFVRAT